MQLNKNQGNHIQYMCWANSFVLVMAQYVKFCPKFPINRSQRSFSIINGMT